MSTFDSSFSDSRTLHHSSAHCHSYHSPIAIEHRNAIKIHQHFELDGVNLCAEYHPDTKIFEVKDEVTLQINHRKYQLVEYHFHSPSEHSIYQNTYRAEIHFVFVEILSKREHIHEKPRQKCKDICGCLEHTDNTLVLGFFVQDSDEIKCLEAIQPKIPLSYYEYDGTLTTGLYSPVRWVVAVNPLYFHLKDIFPIAKPARPIQHMDGRIILFEHSYC